MLLRGQATPLGLLPVPLRFHGLNKDAAAQNVMAEINSISAISFIWILVKGPSDALDYNSSPRFVTLEHSTS